MKVWVYQCITPCQSKAPACLCSGQCDPYRHLMHYTDAKFCHYMPRHFGVRGKQTLTWLKYLLDNATGYVIGKNDKKAILYDECFKIL